MIAPSAKAQDWPATAVCGFEAVTRNPAPTIRDAVEMVYQLRIYTIRQGEMGEWLEEWRALIAPLRRRYGFEVVGAWTTDESDRFVWVLRYSGPKSWAEADADYYQSPERAALNPDPARHITHSDHWLMQDASGPGTLLPG